MGKGLGQLQQEILRVLEEEEADRMPIHRRRLTRELATRLGKWQEPMSDEEFLRELPPDFDSRTTALLLQIRGRLQAKCLIPNAFSASVSRALRKLEERGLITRIGRCYVCLNRR